MALNDNITINNNNYSRTQTEVTLGGAGYLAATPGNLTPFIKGIEYTETQDKEFGWTIGSNRPSHFGVGNITAEGTLTMDDAGLQKLNEIAVSMSLPSYLYLGQAGQINIEVKYTAYDNTVKTDLLEVVHFTNYTQGVNTDDIINEREVNMIIGRVNVDLVNI